MSTEASKKVLAELPECKQCWEFFLRLIEVPRGSFYADKIIPFFKNFCEERKLDYTIDKVNNVLIRIPATPGYESKPCVCLQGHWDIVNQKTEDIDFDFNEDAHVPRIVEKDGKKWLMATNTSLGADDGIGVATALSIALDKDLKHGPLEVLITANEEVGLVGATDLQPGILKSKYLINIDSEDYGIMTISCAGGFMSEYTRKVEYKPIPEGFEGIKLEIRGFRGGHSGTDIPLPIGSALKALARLLQGPSDCECCRLVSLECGTAHNAIPRDANAVIAVQKDKVKCVKEQLEKVWKEIANQYSITDPKCSLKLVDIPKPAKGIETSDAHDVIAMLILMPSGVIRMSPSVSGLVETSYATTVVKMDEERGECYILGSGRSCEDPELDYLYLSNKLLAQANKFTALPMSNRYGAWPVKVGSHLQDVFLQEWKSIIGTDMKVEAIHAGLECGCIITTHPEIDAVSVGPTLVSPHSPIEALLIETVVPTYKVIESVVTKLAE